MLIDRDAFELIEEFESFAEFAKYLLTGHAVRAAVEDGQKIFLTMTDDAPGIYMQFVEELDFTSADAALRAGVDQNGELLKEDEFFEEKITLNSVNEALYRECVALYPKIKDKITSENSTEAVNEILIQAAHQKARGEGRV